MENSALLLFTKTHEWVRFVDETTAFVGITDFAQQELGDIVFINLPAAGDEVKAGETLASVESVKAASDIFSPVTGTVAEVNEELAGAPQKINESPYEAWIAKIADISGKKELIGAEEYMSLAESGRE